MVFTQLALAAGLAGSFPTPEALDAYRIRDMRDAGMGSIRFMQKMNDRKAGTLNTAELWYTDSDGVLVCFVLSLDDGGEPWEIDAWKTDFSALQRPPSIADIHVTSQ